MCGRFTLTRSAAEIAAHFGLEAGPEGLPELTPRYNAAPTQEVASVRVDASGRRVLELRQFGLVPHWAKDPGGAARRINARVETVTERPAYRDAARRRRCLVPADGFYEWQVHPRRKRPHHVALPGGGLFAIAGLYEDWRGAEGRTLGSLTLLTREAWPPLRALHERMPLLVDPESYAVWLDPARRDAAAVLQELSQARGRELVARPVDFRVNDVRHDDEACLAPAEEPQLRLADF